MKTKILLSLAAVAALAALFAISLFTHASTTNEMTSNAATAAVPAKVKIQPTPPAALPEPAPAEVVSSSEEQIVREKASTSLPAAKSPAQAREPLQDPAAREALAFVGDDPEAEAYWLDAIFDPSLPAQEREDLMEDLNENGLSDPKHPGPEDLPLILNRLALIEEIAPYGDEFMQEHLGEAYKDLGNMLAGEPVQ